MVDTGRRNAHLTFNRFQSRCLLSNFLAFVKGHSHLRNASMRTTVSEPRLDAGPQLDGWFSEEVAR